MTEPDSLSTSTDAGQSDALEFEALTTIVRALQGLPVDARVRVLGAVATFMGLPIHGQTRPISWSASAATRIPDAESSVPSFSADRAPSPKEFLFDKKPLTDVEKIACLAYYLAHYRETPYFKTLDISKLNSEAAQLKFSNAAYAVDNATKAGLLVPASKGAKQLSALGELYVQALPDRAAARNAIAHARPKKKNRRNSRGGTQAEGNGMDQD